MHHQIHMPQIKSDFQTNLLPINIAIKKVHPKNNLALKHAIPKVLFQNVNPDFEQPLYKSGF